MSHLPAPQFDHIRERISNINEELANTDDGLPVISVSAGCAFGKNASSGTDLFEHADQALYEAKRNGSHRSALYSPC